jgi:hypothetical protein
MTTLLQHDAGPSLKRVRWTGVTKGQSSAEL